MGNSLSQKWELSRSSSTGKLKVKSKPVQSNGILINGMFPFHVNSVIQFRLKSRQKQESKNMVQNHCVAKSINDAGWYQLMQFTKYKAEYAGKFVEFVNPAGTSQACICGFSVPKDLSVRTHICPSCGPVKDYSIEDQCSGKPPYL